MRRTEQLQGLRVMKFEDGIVMYGHPRCCKGETDLKRR